MQLFIRDGRHVVLQAAPDSSVADVKAAYMAKAFGAAAAAAHSDAMVGAACQAASWSCRMPDRGTAVSHARQQQQQHTRTHSAAAVPETARHAIPPRPSQPPVLPDSTCAVLRQVLLHNSRQLRDGDTLLHAGVTDGATLSVSGRLLGGGGDGGSTGAESRSCYLEMYAEKKPDKVCAQGQGHAAAKLWAFVQM
jgi:hypothetical protein